MKTEKKIWYGEFDEKYEATFLNGKLHGLLICWSNSLEPDQKEYEQTYEHGVLNGKTRGWDDEGNLEFEGEFKDDKKHGKWLRFWENGQLEMEEHYQQGKLHGRVREWEDTGELIAEYQYEDGILKS